MTQTDNQTTVIINDSSSAESNIATPEQSSGAGEKKVQLDVEGAPFLEEQKATPAPEEKKEEKQEEAKKEEPRREESKKDGEEEQPKKSKKKLIIILGLAMILLLGIGGALAFFFLMPEEDALPEGIPPDAYIVVVEDADYADYYHTEFVGDEVRVYSTTLEPFWIQLKNEDNSTVFLVCTFTLITEDSRIFRRLEAEMPKIRDSIRYFLNTKDYVFLTSYTNYPAIKRQLLNVVNKEIILGEFDDILYDNYVIK